MQKLMSEMENWRQSMMKTAAPFSIGGYPTGAVSSGTMKNPEEYRYRAWGLSYPNRAAPAPLRLPLTGSDIIQANLPPSTPVVEPPMPVPTPPSSFTQFGRVAEYDDKGNMIGYRNPVSGELDPPGSGDLTLSGPLPGTPAPLPPGTIRVSNPEDFPEYGLDPNGNYVMKVEKNPDTGRFSRQIYDANTHQLMGETSSADLAAEQKERIDSGNELPKIIEHPRGGGGHKRSPGPAEYQQGSDALQRDTTDMLDDLPVYARPLPASNRELPQEQADAITKDWNEFQAAGGDPGSVPYNSRPGTPFYKDPSTLWGAGIGAGAGGLLGGALGYGFGGKGNKTLSTLLGAGLGIGAGGLLGGISGNYLGNKSN